MPLCGKDGLTVPKIIYHDVLGGRHEVQVSAGSTVMEAAVDNDIPGIVAECGGACACATCHAYVAADWLAKLPAIEEMEDAMLDSVLDRRPNSRLTCQIEVTAELDGFEVQVADNEG
jgi:2Fe-2S ferredoxin